MPANKRPVSQKNQKYNTVVKPATKKPVIKISKAMTKTELLTAISSNTAISKKDLGIVFDTLAHCIALHVQGKSPYIFTLPGLLKIKVMRKPATKERKGINPFTGDETVFKAKPARNVVKILALKKLKEMAK